MLVNGEGAGGVGCQCHIKDLSALVSLSTLRARLYSWVVWCMFHFCVFHEMRAS